MAKPQSNDNLPITTAHVARRNEEAPIPGVRLIQEIGTCFHAYPSRDRLQTGLGVDRKTRLPEAKPRPPRVA